MAYKFLTIFFVIFIIQNLSAEEKCQKCHSDKIHYEAIGSCTLCHKGNGKTSRIDLAHENILNRKYARFLLRDSFPVFKGFMLIKIGACRRCHTIGDKGNRLATNLNESIREKSIKTLIEAIKKPFYYMPQFNFSDDQIDWILNGLLDYAFYAKKINDGFVTVHFSTTKESKNIFSEKCGKCHKIILKQVGPLGDGERGPNLSGLYMEEFNSIKEVHRWDKKALKKWLKNPRVIKKGALMPVILKNDREIEEILEFFNG